MQNYNSKFKIFNFSLLTFNLKRGQSLVELLIVVGLMAILLPALLTGLVVSREGKDQDSQRSQALSILTETIESTRSVRENGWASFAINGTFHPEVSGSSWTLVGGTDTVNGFTRQAVISDVYRNGLTGPIVDAGEPGAVLDPSTKKIATTVSWSQPHTSSVGSTIYLTRHLENNSYTETTQTDFDAGTKSSVTIRASTPPALPDDGEVVLGSGGYGDWCTPTLLANTLDLPGQGYASSITAIEGKAFAGTGENSSGLSFMQMNITDAHPPVPSIVGTFDGHKTNGVFGESDYGYITTDTNAKEVVIIDISTLPFTEIGFFNAPGSTRAEGIFVHGSIGYVTIANKLYNFDLSSKIGSRPALDPDGVVVSPVGNARKVFVVGDFAYVAISGASVPIELAIVDVSDPSNLQLVGWADVDGRSGEDVFVDNTGNRAYLVSTSSPSQKEFFIINTESKIGARPTVGSYEANGMGPSSVEVVTGNRAIIVGAGGEEYQVIDISNEGSPVRCGGAQLDDNIHDISSVIEADSDVYSYIVTDDADREFRIIEGGPGGGYATSGIFESQTFDPGYKTANNRFIATFSEPLGTEIKFQVTLADKIGGVCPTSGNYTFVGPSGTEADYFEQASGVSITFPFTTYSNYTNPGQCLRYKAFLSTTNVSTPVLYDVTINYSP